MAKDWPGHTIRFPPGLWELFDAAVETAGLDVTKTSTIRELVGWYCQVGPLPKPPDAQELTDHRNMWLEQRKIARHDV